MASKFLENVLSIVRRGVKLSNLPEDFYHLLSKPDRILIVKIPVRMDDGSLKIFEGYRVQHNGALGPYKGGIRFHPEVSLEDDIALATLMTLKNSLAGLPYGGGKGAVKVNPKSLSKGELERLSRGYARAISPLIGDQVDIPAPDVGTDSQIMAWMVDEYSKLKGYNVPGVFTSKPPILWGNPVREYATGFGTAVVAREAAIEYLGGIEKKTVAVQGFGNVGQWTAYWLSKFGAKIIAVSDTSGTLYDPDGINVDKAIEVKKKTRKVINYPGGRKIEGNTMAPLYTDVDILVPAALENQITKENAKKVKAKVISEGANGPTTPEAEAILTKRGVIIVPDFLANAGGVIMSYLEWVENLQWYFWDEEETRARLESIIKKNFHKVNQRYRKLKEEREDATMRDAALQISLERIYEATKARGWL